MLKLDAWRGAIAATTAYLLITLVMTWPLVRGLTRDVPSDLGDPVLNMWILAWDAEQLRAIAGGDFARIPGFFDANIFHPAPLTLAYSEHLIAQALQILPVYAVTRDPILCYNLLFLSTFVLSGLGGFLLVREFTGSARAGFVAGLLFAFALYRWTQLAHVQVLSAHWMPFVLYGLRRYFATRHLRPLAGAAAALIAQNLSCGYYLLYFAPTVLLYALWEISSHNLGRARSVWLQLAATALIVGLVTAPFLIPYRQVRETFQFSRDVREIVRYSADVYSYWTAPSTNRVWRDVADAYSKPEADLFPGITPLVLAVVAIGAAIARAARTGNGRPARAPVWVLTGIAAVGGAYAVLAVIAVFARRIDLDLGLFTVRATNVTRLLLPPVIALFALCCLWPATRSRFGAFARMPEAILLLVVIAGWWLSLGPAPRVMGRPLELWSPYRFLYEFVPGFDGVRAPARLAMIVTLGLSMLAGLAVAHLERVRAGTAGALVACVVFLVETSLPPLRINGVSAAVVYATPEARVVRPARAPAVYSAVANAPADAVLLEMPIGELNYDVRAVYYSAVHWRRLVNGYSGFFPPHYDELLSVLSTVARGDERAWPVLQRLGVTHVIVHEAAYLDDEGVRFAEWLRRHGAVEVFRDGRDTLFALRH